MWVLFRLVNEFVASIFEKRNRTIQSIDYYMFRDLIPNSVLIDVESI